MFCALSEVKGMVIKMKLKDLLKFVDSSLTLEIMGTKEKHDSKAALTEEKMNCLVKSIETDDGELLIKLDAPKQNQLEQFDYCFECGM